MKLSRIEMMKLLSLPLSILILSYLGFLAIKFQVAIENDTQSNNPAISFRAPGSINTLPDIQKKSLQTQILANELREFKKPHGPIEVEVASVGNRAILNNDRAELIGTIKIERDIDQIEVQWHLPQGVEMIGGLTKSSFSSLKAGQQKEIHIQVLSHSNENQQIHFEASFQQGNDKVGHTAQFNTLIQPNLNQAAQQKASIHSLGMDDSQEKIWQ